MVSQSAMPAGLLACTGLRDAARPPYADEDALTRAIIAIASKYGRYGYRRVATARAYGYGLSIAITSGAWTLYRAGLMTGEARAS